MTSKQLKVRWDALAIKDAMWAVLTEEGKEHGAWNKDEFYQTGQADVARAISWLTANGIEIDRTKALDFGCGLGRLTAALSERFSEVDAVDISSEMISRAKAFLNWSDKVRFYEVADSSLSHLESNQYSFVLSLIALQHIPHNDALRYIASITRLLRPGGVAYLQMFTFLDPSSPKCLAKLTRDESALNRLYRRIASRISPKPELMQRFIADSQPLWPFLKTGGCSSLR